MICVWSNPSLRLCVMVQSSPRPVVNSSRAFSEFLDTRVFSPKSSPSCICTCRLRFNYMRVGHSVQMHGVVLERHSASMLIKTLHQSTAQRSSTAYRSLSEWAASCNPLLHECCNVEPMSLLNLDSVLRRTLLSEWPRVARTVICNQLKHETWVLGMTV